MSGLHFDSLDDCPPGLRKLLEKQAAKEKSKTTDKSGPHNDAGETPIGLTATSPDGGSKGKRKYRNTPTERLLPNGECIKFGSKKEAAYFDLGEERFQKHTAQTNLFLMEQERIDL